MKFMYKTSYLTLLLLTFAGVKVFCCEPDVPSFCLAYKDSDVIFAGTLSDMSEDNSSATKRAILRFRVSKVFKGTVPSSVEVKFYLSDCSMKPIKGEKYLVYANGSKNSPYLITKLNSRTNLLTKLKPDIDRLKNYSKNDRYYYVDGIITGLARDDLRKLKVRIRGNSEDTKLKTTAFGEYVFKTRKRQKFKVLIELPFRAEIWGDVSISSENSSYMVLEYEVDFTSLTCDYHEIGIRR